MKEIIQNYLEEQCKIDPCLADLTVKDINVIIVS